MVGRTEEENVRNSEELTIDVCNEVGEKRTVDLELPKTENVTFTDSRLIIPDSDFEIPYSSINDFNSLTNWEGEEERGLITAKFKATRTRIWRMILEDGTYFTLSKENTKVEKNTERGNWLMSRAGQVNVNAPKICPATTEQIKNDIKKENDPSTLVLVEYLDIDGELRVEGWRDGASEINAGIDGGAKTKGASLGLESGAVSLGVSSSKSSIEGDIEGTISDNTYSTPIESFIIFENKMIIDSEISLELFYDEVDRVTVTEEGLIIHVGEATYRTKVRRCKSKLNDIREHINNWKSDEQAKRPDSEETVADKLRQLNELHEENILSDKEFENKKAELLDDF